MRKRVGDIEMKRFGAVLIIVLTAAGSARAALTELTGAVDVKVGNYYGGPACVLTTSGGVKCWGSGALGDGVDSHSRDFAGDVIGLTSGVSAIAVGAGRQSCAAMAAGGVKCWGANDSGQLGDGTTTGRSLPVDVVGLSGNVVAIAGGTAHTCAVLSTGGVKCWGSNDSGQLGIGTLGGSYPTPQDVVGLAGAVTGIAAAEEHTCAIVSGAGVQCWGANEAGQLGDGTTTTRPAPVTALGLPSGIASVAAGGTMTYSTPYYFSCAVTTSGATKCWGDNEQGQLGDGTYTDHLTAFDVLGLTSGVATVAAGAQQSAGTYNSSGMADACALTTAGGVKCWGGTNPKTPTDVSGLTSGAAAISVGEFNCAVIVEGRVRCWRPGALGYPPTAVMTGTGPQLVTVESYGPVPVGDTRSVIATGTASGISVTFTSLTPSICSVSASTSLGPSPFRVNGTQYVASVTGLASGACTLEAHQAGNAYYEPAAPVAFQFRVGDPLAQTITFGPVPTVPVNGVGWVSATASSGLPVTFHSNTPSVCSVSGNVVNGVSLGNCTIAATQAGDVYYAATENTQTFPVTANSGTHSLIVTWRGNGTVTSSPAGIDCGNVCAGNFSGSVTLTATPGAGALFAGWSGACSGSGTCTLPMTADVTVGAAFAIDSPIPRLGNLSTRGITSNADPMIAGFIIGGSAPKTIVVTGVGPSLNAFGIDNAISNPNLTLVRSSDGVAIAFNDNWGSASNASQLQASGFAPTHPLESAVMMTLAPGAYTAIVRGTGSEVGVGLAGVFEVDHPEVPLVNLSTRGLVATANNVMIGGFIIQGNNTQTVVVNVAGPSLANFGVANPLANPTLTIVRSSDNTTIATNDDWQTQANPADVAAIQASGFRPNHALEPAVILTLAPGAYTAIVQGSRGTIGTGLVGVFKVQ